MDIGEAIAVNIITDKHDDDCYFCNAKKTPESNTNKMTDERAEDDEAEDGAEDTYAFKNNSGELGSNLGECPEPRDVSAWGGTEKVSVAAHHLIPGNASMKPSNLFKCGKYLKVEGAADGNIGYNINSAHNGVWLPGNYAVRPWGPRDEDVKRQYAYEAIKKYGFQFHDAHPEYSNFVLQCLNDIHAKLKLNQEVWCEEASKKDKEEGPLYMLVARLNTVSARMAKLLRFPCKGNWKKNVYTSRFSLQFMNSKPDY